MSSLKGKIVAITGGGTGIGAGIATVLAEAGCRVAIGGRRLEKLQAIADSVSSETPIHCHTLDVADPSSVDAFFADVKSHFGDPDILVNSAGINILKRTMAEMVPEDWDRVMQINATGAYRCIHAVLPAMRERRDGLVINISSVAGKRAISLGGVVFFDEGVRITNVYPGEVNTPILDNRPNPVSQEHKDSILQPEDIASVVATICALPPRANVPEVVIKPTKQEWV